MKFKVEKGHKGDHDKMLFVCTDSWEAIKFDDILYILDHMFKNEDYLYPPPQYKGRAMLLEKIQLVFYNAHPSHGGK